VDAVRGPTSKSRRGLQSARREARQAGPMEETLGRHAGTGGARLHEAEEQRCVEGRQKCCLEAMQEVRRGEIRQDEARTQE
jgi:hypothetical protein